MAPPHSNFVEFRQSDRKTAEFWIFRTRALQVPHKSLHNKNFCCFFLDLKLTLIFCSDGWDRTSQVSALAQIILDPYYRTITGFCSLIQKVEISFIFVLCEKGILVLARICESLCNVLGICFSWIPVCVTCGLL